MRRCVLLDTGPLVAVINRRDQFHSWVTTQWANIEPPFMTLHRRCYLGLN